MIGVIDIGSNTIRVVVYDDTREILNRAVTSRIFEYTENRRLNEAGIVWLSNVIGTLSVMAEQFCCPIYAFATSAFRDLANRDDVAAYVKEYTGIDVTILSGEEEAECDYISLRGCVGNVAAVGLDLGGGSGQLLKFDENRLAESKSLPIGAKRLKRKFVSGILPDKDELGKVYGCVRELIGDVTTSDILYVMGGSARAVYKLKKHLYDGENAFSPEQLQGVIEFSLEENAEEILRKITKERFDTVIVGAVVIKAVADKIDAKHIKIVDCSVREGFVKKVDA